MASAAAKAAKTMAIERLVRIKTRPQANRAAALGYGHGRRYSTPGALVLGRVRARQEEQRHRGAGTGDADAEPDRADQRRALAGVDGIASHGIALTVRTVVVDVALLAH